MPVMNCPDCDKEISPLAAACTHCGRPGAAPASAAPLVLPVCVVAGAALLLLSLFLPWARMPESVPRLLPGPEWQQLRSLMKSSLSYREWRQFRAIVDEARQWRHYRASADSAPVVETDRAKAATRLTSASPVWTPEDTMWRALIGIVDRLGPIVGAIAVALATLEVLVRAGLFVAALRHLAPDQRREGLRGAIASWLVDKEKKGFCFAGIVGSGGVLLSLAVQYARWSEFLGMGYYLCLAGSVLMFGTLLVGHAWVKLQPPALRS